MTLNAVIGAGIFGIPGKVFALTGVWSLAAFVACGAFAALVALCFAEVGSRLRETGGPYLYAREAFGEGPAFHVGTLMWVARVSAFAANSNLLLNYVAALGWQVDSGAARTVFLCALVSILAALNILGIRNAAAANQVFTFGKLAPLAVFVVVGAFAVVPARLTVAAPPSNFGSNFSTAILLLVYAFTGFEMTAVPGGEMKDPQRALPRALVIAAAIIALVYCAVQVVCIGVLPGLADSTRPVADASRVLFGPIGSSLIVLGIVVSILGNLHVTVLACSRIPFAMAESGDLPVWIAHTHPRFRSPDRAIALSCAAILAMTLGGTFFGALSLSTVSRLLAYMSTCAALPVLRRRGPADFALPGGLWISALALSVTAWLLAHAPTVEWKAVGVVVGAGLAYQGWKARNRGIAAARYTGGSE